MLGKTAGGLYWMFRSLERSENTARLIEAGFRIALTRSSDPKSEWRSVVTTAGVMDGFKAKHDQFAGANVVDYLLRDPDNPSSVITSIETARTNARMVRTALTTEVWEAVNDTWMTFKEVLKRPVKETELPEVLGTIRQQTALVRGAVHGTMLRNDSYDFAQLGSAVERADNTARILDVKYYTLLPSASAVGSSLDNVQWEMILRAVSAHRAYRWINEGEISSASITDFLILDARFPRSLAFGIKYTLQHLEFLAKDYRSDMPSRALADALRDKLRQHDIASIFEAGLHQFLQDFIRDNNAISRQIETDFRFNG